MSTLEADFEKRFPAGLAIEGRLYVPASAPSVTVLFGPSGSGKTTVLRCLAGLERPERGFIRFGDQTWFDAGRNLWVPPQRRQLGHLSQDYALFPHLSVADNVAYGLGGLKPAERQRQVAELLELFGLAGLERRSPGQLSGGEQQRVALARALARRPSLLLLDEPLSALDAPTRELLRRQLRIWLAGLGVPTLLVTHDREEALTLGDAVVILDRGRVLQEGSVANVFARPACVAVARIVGVETIEPARVVEVHAGLASVAVGKALLRAVSGKIRPGAAHVCIRAENVLLERGEGQDGALNRLPGQVQEVAREGLLTRVRLDCGFPLVALLSPKAAQQMGLHPGEQVAAVVHAEDVHLAPPEPSC
jgi:molybdate transport system ATP-binding protein